MGCRVSWRFLNATARGTSHERTGVPCQDDCLVDLIPHDGADTLLAIASDGAGSASCAEEGSALVCETLLRVVEQWLQTGGTVEALTRDVAEEWVGSVRASIAARAAQKELTPRDFACTLVAAVVSSTAAAFLQIGDGAIVTVTADGYDVIFWPDGGEYANMTFFTTDDDWPRHLHFEVRDAALDELALMTDGLQRLALEFETRSAHAPFFVPMFHALRRSPRGYASALEPPLVAFLGGEAVNARTDDDKSLVLATRRSGAADGSH
jgi:hypothetical protein